MKKPNKQPEVTAATLKRMAVELRKSAKAMGMKYCLPTIAKIFDAEAKRIRAKR